MCNIDGSYSLTGNRSILHQHSSFYARQQVVLRAFTPATDPSPDEIETLGFHHMIAQSL